MVAHTFNPNTQEAETGGSLLVRGQPGLQSLFQDNQGCYTEKPCLEKPEINRLMYVKVLDFIMAFHTCVKLHFTLTHTIPTYSSPRPCLLSFLQIVPIYNFILHISLSPLFLQLITILSKIS